MVGSSEDAARRGIVGPGTDGRRQLVSRNATRRLWRHSALRLTRLSMVDSNFGPDDDRWGGRAAETGIDTRLTQRIPPAPYGLLALCA